MLGFTDIKMQSEFGVIGPDNCYIHLDIQALFYIFRPELSMVLKGKVTRTSKDHVGCLVYNTFNISLPNPAEDEGTWLGSTVSVTNEVEFKITYVDLNARLPHIRGELRSIITDGIGINNDTSPNKTKKKHKKKHRGMEVDESITEQSSKKRDKSEKKNKKKRFPSVGQKEIASLHTEVDLDNVKEEPYTIKPKKKHKEKRTSESTTTIKSEIKEELEETDEWQVKKKKAKKDKHKKKRAKSESEQMNISLDSLDIKSLFAANSSIDFDRSSQSHVTTADGVDKKNKRKRSQSMYQETYLDKVKLEEDSDLEKIIGRKEKRGSKSGLS